MLVLLLLFSAAASAAEAEAVDPYRFIIEYASLFDWEMSAEDMLAYFENIGFSCKIVATDSVRGSKTIEEQTIGMYAFVSEKKINPFALEIPNAALSMAQLTSVVESIFGQMTKEGKGMSNLGWNIGNGVLLTLTELGARGKATTISFMVIGEENLWRLPVSAGKFSSSVLAASSEAKSSIAQKHQAAITGLPPFVFGNGISSDMTREQVIAAEGKAPDVEDDEGIYYDKLTFRGLNASLLYLFSGEKISDAGYTMAAEHSSPEDYIADYNAMNKALTSEYGAPISDEMEWKNDLYKNAPQKYGHAVAVGHLIYATIWDLGNVFITHQLSGDNFEIVHMIVYHFDPFAEQAPDTAGL